MLLTPSNDNGHRMQWSWSVFALGLLAGSLVFFGLRARAHRQPEAIHQTAVPSSVLAVQGAKVTAFEQGMGLRFEPNQGQTDSRVKFLSRNPQYNLFLTSSEAVFTLNSPLPSDGAPNHGVRPTGPQVKPAERSVLRMRMVGAHPGTVTGAEPTAGFANYFIGRDPKAWVRNVPQFSRVNYENVYPGVDMTFYGNQREFEFDLVVKPGARTDQIALRFAGARQTRINADGDLILSSAAGDLAMRKPVAYQRVNGVQQPVDVRFVARNAREFGFMVGRHDPTRELVIDPSFIYSTFLGGSALDAGHAIAADINSACATNNTCAAYVTGETLSADFPKSGGISPNGPNAGLDVFITKFNSDGTLAYSTYLGGTKDDSGNAIAVDASGNVYIAGGTGSNDFPVTPIAPTPTCPTSVPAAQANYGGGTDDGFVAKIDPTGACLLYATYAGGSDVDIFNGIAVDSTGNMYAGGDTKSTNLVVVQPLQSSNKGMHDGYIAKIDASTGAFSYLDYLGGSQTDFVSGIAVDGSNNIYVTGITISTNFPVKGSSPYQSKCGTDGNCNPVNNVPEDNSFVTAIKGDFSQYIYSTYFGGSGSTDSQNIVVDPSSNAYFAGQTSSSDLKPVNPYQSSLVSGANNVFVAELDPTGSTAKYLTYLGGSNSDIALSLALDSKNRIYLTGQTTSSDFPIASPIQSVYAGTGATGTGSGDAFVSLLNPSLSGTAQLQFSTFLGGTQAEDTQAGGISVDPQGNVYVTGDTSSSANGALGFPVVNPFQKSLNTAPDAFVAKITPTVTPVANFTVDISAVSPSAVAVGSSGTTTVTVMSKNGFAGSVNLTCNLTPSTAVPPTCQFQPLSVSVPGNGSGQSTLTLKTSKMGKKMQMVGLWLPLAGLAIAGSGLAGFRRRKRLYFLGACLMLTALLLMPGCVSGTTNTGSGGTTPGSYTVTVTGTSLGASTTSTSQSFTVQ